MPEKVDFDEYAAKYEDLLKEQLSFFSGERSYFSEYKIKRLREIYHFDFESILDFGAGIGLSLPHLKKYFPKSHLYASDISEASLDHIKRNHSDVTVISDAALDGRRFDMILIITVMHHIAPSIRNGVLSRIENLLNPGGKVCIFEHNPYNPVTRRMVSTCPFDEDAVLLTMKETKDLLSARRSLSVSKSGYTLFFPNSLAPLRPLEKYIRWVPMGGQYYVVATKQ